MLWPDLVNGLFESCGALVLLKNIQILYHDKQLRGVSPWPTLFFTAWGIWNLAYYPLLGQWWSFVGGVGVVSINSLWLAMLVYYKWLRRTAPEAQ